MNPKYLIPKLLTAGWLAPVSLALALGVVAQEPERQLVPVGEIVDAAFQNHQVVMMNEAHSGQRRNIRTRIIGQTILPRAHKHGVRHLAMEALTPGFAEAANQSRKLPESPSRSGYLHQPEMRRFMQTALDLGWDLVAYEADLKSRPADLASMEKSNWREEQQAKNLAGLLDELEEDAKILVWCGNSHLEKEAGATPDGELYPMGFQFRKITGLEPFTIDQTVTVDFFGDNKRFEKWSRYEGQLKENFYGTLGFMVDEASAVVLSVHNRLE